jgi:acetyl esterase/lipase
MPRRCSICRWAAWLTCFALPLLRGQEAPPSERLDTPEARPGEEFRLPWPAVKREVPVYVPTDYSPARRWPVVLLYHGLNGEPTTELIRQLTGGKGAIVVGMTYIEPSPVRRTAAQQQAYQAKELAQLERMLEELPRHVRIDRGRVFLAGISRGGWQVSVFAETAQPRVAGYLILLAGRFPFVREPRPDLSERAVYVGTGENDEANAYARMAAQYYDRCGATVTWEEYPGRGHEVDATAVRLQAWAKLLLTLDGEERRGAAREWVTERLAKTRDGADAMACFRALDEVAEDPHVHFCGSELRTQLQAMTESVSMAAAVQSEVQARRVYERALWQEQTAASAADLEGALELYRQAEKRYAKSVYGRLAEREVRRVQPMVERARTQAEPSPSRRRPPAPPMPPRLKLKTP